MTNSLSRQATGTFVFHVERDDDGNEINFFPEHQDGDLVVFSHELLCGARPNLLQRNENIITLRSLVSGPTFHLTVLSEDDKVVLAQIKR